MRPARNRKIYEADGVRFECAPAAVTQIVENASVAAWNAAAEHGSLDLGGHLAARRARSAAAFREGLDPAHYVALTRARLQTLFGRPSGRGDNYKSSFQYDLVASTPGGQVYFVVGDHKASEVLIFWEYSTSTPDARRRAEQAFWSLVGAASPSEYEDVFSYEDAAGLRYGYRGGCPWVTSLAPVSEPSTGHSARVPQPTGHVSIPGILALAAGATAALLATHAGVASVALSGGLLTSLVVSLLWRASAGG
jgi:hypothetical protein